MTPSEQAKQYAAENGFTITSNYSRRRYIVSRGDHVIGERAKYDDVLRLMQSVIGIPTSPRWRLWWKCPKDEFSGYRDYHNYADAVKQLRRLYSSAETVIIAGTKYRITCVA